MYNTEQLLTIKQLADRLQVSDVTLYRWRTKGMPSKNVGRTVRFDYEEVMKWINSDKKII